MDTPLLPTFCHNNPAVGLGVVSAGSQRQGRPHLFRVGFPAHTVYTCLGVDLHHMAHRQDLGGQRADDLLLERDHGLEVPAVCCAGQPLLGPQQLILHLIPVNGTPHNLHVLIGQFLPRRSGLQRHGNGAVIRPQNIGVMFHTLDRGEQAVRHQKIIQAHPRFSRRLFSRLDHHV